MAETELHEDQELTQRLYDALRVFLDPYGPRTAMSALANTLAQMTLECGMTADEGVQAYDAILRAKERDFAEAIARGEIVRVQ